MIGNMDFNKKKAIWQKELKINEGKKDSRVIVVVLIYSFNKINSLNQKIRIKMIYMMLRRRKKLWKWF